MGIEERIPHVKHVEGIDMFSVEGLSTTYKYVQLYIENVPFIRMGHYDCSKHFLILMSFFKECNENGLQICTEEEMQGFVRGYSMFPKILPPLETDKYRVRGMGYLRISNSQKGICLNGESTDFGIGLDQKHLEDIKPYFQNQYFLRLNIYLSVN